MTTRTPSILLISILTVIVFAPQYVDACPVCFSAKPGAREAFLLSTAFLTFFPLGLLGSMIFWFRKHIQKKGK